MVYRCNKFEIVQNYNTIHLYAVLTGSPAVVARKSVKSFNIEY